MSKNDKRDRFLKPVGFTLRKKKPQIKRFSQINP
jgi:hypothetical protein